MGEQNAFEFEAGRHRGAEPRSFSAKAGPCTAVSWADAGELVQAPVHLSTPFVSSDTVVPSAFAMRSMLNMLTLRAPRSMSLM